MFRLRGEGDQPSIWIALMEKLYGRGAEPAASMSTVYFDVLDLESAGSEEWDIGVVVSSEVVAQPQPCYFFPALQESQEDAPGVGRDGAAVPPILIESGACLVMRERSPETRPRWSAEFNEHEVHPVILPQAIRMGAAQVGGAGTPTTPNPANPPTLEPMTLATHSVRLPAHGTATELDGWAARLIVGVKT
ncbi:hypothetical protein Acsp02_80750 [Actinoplanes sp. NBRC 103695]|nr:hypothetical protein Acsp02_80750 [Actinoplanes sp. NBRC 103695]